MLGAPRSSSPRLARLHVPARAHPATLLHAHRPPRQAAVLPQSSRGPPKVCSGDTAASEAHCKCCSSPSGARQPPGICERQGKSPCPIPALTPPTPHPLPARTPAPRDHGVPVRLTALELRTGAESGAPQPPACPQPEQPPFPPELRDAPENLCSLAASCREGRGALRSANSEEPTFIS